MTEDPDMHFGVDCPCGCRIEVTAPWRDWPVDLEYVCMRCDRTFTVSTTLKDTTA